MAENQQMQPKVKLSDEEKLKLIIFYKDNKQVFWSSTPSVFLCRSHDLVQIDRVKKRFLSCTRCSSSLTMRMAAIIITFLLFVATAIFLNIIKLYFVCTCIFCFVSLNSCDTRTNFHAIETFYFCCNRTLEMA